MVNCWLDEWTSVARRYLHKKLDLFRPTHTSVQLHRSLGSFVCNDSAAAVWLGWVFALHLLVRAFELPPIPSGAILIAFSRSLIRFLDAIYIHVDALSFQIHVRRAQVAAGLRLNRREVNGVKNSMHVMQEMRNVRHSVYRAFPKLGFHLIPLHTDYVSRNNSIGHLQRIECAQITSTKCRKTCINCITTFEASSEWKIS